MQTLEVSSLKQSDPEIFDSLLQENKRQETSLELIASENFVSRSVLEACSSTLTNKYAEGYPSKRYYNGCENADKVESLAIERAKKLFKANFVNVQPHSGSQANLAAFLSSIQPGDPILGMDLSHGGHLTHGSRVNFSGRYFQAFSYNVRKEDHRIDFDQIFALAKEHRPKLIIAGFSAYPRILEFDRFREIADEVGAVLIADIAHIAGLVAAEEHPSPIGIAHITTTTTHKTLRGPRGGLIFSNDEEHAKRINSLVFPGIQGGPFMHVIAAKAVTFQEALSPDFREYICSVKDNAQALAESFLANDLDIVSDGTDNHIVLLDLRKINLTGTIAADALDEAGITVNKNAIPFDPNPPRITSGLRFGSPALTTRGLGRSEFQEIGNLVCTLLKNLDNPSIRAKIRSSVSEITRSFPMDKFRLL